MRQPARVRIDACGARGATLVVSAMPSPVVEHVRDRVAGLPRCRDLRRVIAVCEHFAATAHRRIDRTRGDPDRPSAEVIRATTCAFWLSRAFASATTPAWPWS